MREKAMRAILNWISEFRLDLAAHWVRQPLFRWRLEFASGPRQRSITTISFFPALGAFLFLAACTTLGSIEERAESINLASGKYLSAAILYNILRASEAEPLDFVSFTGVTGHESTNIGIGLPTLIIGPGRTPAQNLFLFGPNTIGAAASNDFNVSVVDDPGSQAALLRPVTPATIGFFLNQAEYNPDHVFFLFISKIVDVDKMTGQVIRAYENEPYGYMETSDHCLTVNDFGLNCHWIRGFYSRLEMLIKNGLSIEVDPTFVPTADQNGKAAFCFDPGIALGTPKAALCRPALIAENAPVSLAQTVIGSIQRAGSKPAGAAPKTFSINAQINPPKNGGTVKPSFSFPDPNQPSIDVYVYTRSVYGAYRFLGELLNLESKNSLSELPERDVLFRPGPNTEGTRILNLTHALSGCWANVNYEGYWWCVPEGAFATKRTFQILNQLFRLFAAPNNQPVTQTVRTVGQ
jgi:hypothetical protein